MKFKVLNKFQKIVCFTFLIASCLVIISSFCFFDSRWGVFQVSGNDNSENFFRTYLAFKSYVFEDRASGKEFYVNFYNKMQTANNYLFYTGLVTLATIVVSGIVGNFKRKKYYISNLIMGIVPTIIAIILSILTIVHTIDLMDNFKIMEPDLVRFQEVCEQYNRTYVTIESNYCMIGIIMPIILMVISVIYTTFTIFKFIATNKVEHSKEVLSNE